MRLSEDRILAKQWGQADGSTFGNNPLAMAVANAVLDGLEEDGFLAAVRKRILSLIIIL